VSSGSPNGGILDEIAAQRVVPVLRSTDVDDAIATARACARAGMRVIELTRSIPEVEVAVSELAHSDELVVGVGTVVTPDEVEKSVEAGARFMVSFGFDSEVVKASNALGITMIPGALTPTEVARCRQAGSSVVKLFPARLIEPSYLRDLVAVMPEMEFMVTGGSPATPGGIGPWLQAGALAVGVGSALGSAAVDGADEVERRCRQLMQALTVRA